MSYDGVDLHDAADTLGVHYQTAYRWVRSGELPAVRVRGRYQLDPDELARFAARRDAPQPRRARRPRQGFEPLAERMFDHLVDGDERAARHTVAKLVDDGVRITTVMQEVLAPALSRVGAEWHAGRLSIWVEHQGSAIVERIIGSHHPTPRGRRRGTAVVAALSGDLHALPTSMAAAALREDNWHVNHLGADMPGDELVRFCEQARPDLAVLTMTNVDVCDDVEQTAATLTTLGVRTLTGGPGRTLQQLVDEARLNS
jgi:MerR family transcriptional regulator, light-induced transcriptional regulator